MQYIAPDSSKGIVEVLGKSRGSVAIIAGGTDVLVRMRSAGFSPDTIVDIKRAKVTTQFKASDKGFTVGAAIPCGALASHKKLLKAWPGVVEAARLIGSDQVQGRCTMVGNLCNASPAADSVPALIAAGAQVIVVGREGRRRVKVAEFIKAPGKTVLKRGEFVEALVLPPQPARSADAYLRFIPRTEMDIAVASAAVWLQLERGKIRRARVVLGAVAPTAVNVVEAEAILKGTRLDPQTMEHLAAACREVAKPIDDKRGTVVFRKRMAGVMACRAAQEAFQRAGGQ